MTDMFQFENKEAYNQNEPITVGGMSVCSMLKKNKNILDIEGTLFSRFSNLVVPLGLQLHPVVNDNYENENHENYEINQFIDSKRFDQLFYSVGKDLGISKSKTHKNRTMKNTTK